MNLHSFFLQDPRGNRILQWQNVKSEMNIIQLEFPLTEEPILGNYKIIVAKKSGDKTNHSFLVEEYGKCHPIFLFSIGNIIRDGPYQATFLTAKTSNSFLANVASTSCH